MTSASSVLTEAALSEVCKLVTDGTHDTPKGVASGYPLIKAKEIRGGVIDFETCDRISEEDHLRVISRSKAEQGDTLFTHIGASLGKAAYVNTNEEFSIKNIALFKPDTTKIDGRYLYYLVVSPEFQSLAIAARTGAAQPFLSLGHLRSHRVRYLAEMFTQQRIASILSAYDDLIENNTRRIAILEEMARRLYEEWFVHFRFPGHEGVEFDGDLPRGWRSAPLGDLVEERRDAVQPDAIDPDTPYVGLEHIPRRSITLREWSTASTVQSTKLLFVENDILFGKIRPYFHKVSLAPLSGVTSSDTIVLRALSQEHLPLALCCASSDTFVDHATQTSNGTKMPRANWNVLKQYPVVVPESGLLTRFNEFLFPLIQNLKSFNRKNTNLRAQRDLLLPKLVSGEIDVSEVEAQVQEDAA